MKNTKMRLSFGLICAASVIGASSCGKSLEATVDDIKSDVKSPELMHKWDENKCNTSTALKLIGASYKTQYEFTGTKVKRTDQYFSSGDCKDIATSVVYEGTFEEKDEVQENINQINITYNTVSAIAQNDAGKNVLNAANFCSTHTWAVNVPVDLTAHTRDTLCPLENLPEPIFDIFTVENDTLYFGKSTSDHDKKTAEKRANELDRETSYHKI